MISFTFYLRNPWNNEFKNLWNRAYKTPFKHKFVELEITRDFTLISLMFNWSVRQSHAGLDLEFGLFGYNVHFNFYDNRHWSTELNSWENHD